MVSDHAIVEAHVGFFHIEGNLNRAFEKAVNDSKFKFYDFEDSTDHMHRLLNGNIISIDLVSSRLTLFDSDFKQIKVINKLNNWKVKIFSATSDTEGAVYLTFFENDAIVKTDLDLNVIKVIGEKDASPYRDPRGITFYNGFLYLCDFGNQRIAKLDTEMDCLDSFFFERCNEIIIANGVACISAPEGGSYFYDLKTKTLLKKQCFGRSRHFVFDKLFYELVLSSPRKMHVYSHEGCFVKEREIPTIKRYYRHHQDGIILTDKNWIAIASPFSSIIVKIMIQDE